MDLRQQAFRIERILALLLFVVLMGFFVYRVSGIAEVAERMSVEAHIQQLQAGLDMKFASLMMINQQNKALSWSGINPFLFITAASKSEPAFSDYAGEQWDVKLKNMGKGSWVYDKKPGVIIYRLKNARVLSGDDPVKGRMVWKVVPVVVEENALVPGKKHNRVDSVRLRSLYEYKWNY